MEDQGGVSVSDVVARATGEQPQPKPDRRRVQPAPGWESQSMPPRPQAARSSTPQAPASGERAARPRRTTSASPLPEAPPPRRPAVTNPGPQQTAAAQPPRRPRRPAPTAVAEPPNQTGSQPVPPPARRPARRPAGPNGEKPRFELDPLTMTDEMEAIDEATMVRRKIDHTLARFSAAHDEMEAE
ncbi:MAG TPA: hypothetical protein VJX66_30305, partial [Amycolatopsis sp.]|nr:hypothetical protein [Amycolatopsis sp.]